MQGTLITFEGIEGCGKTTQIGLFTEWLEGEGIPTLLTREPGGTSLGEEIRNVLLHGSDVEINPRAELLLYLASRAQLVKDVIKPALVDGKVVLVDRFSDSTVAYQGWGRGLDIRMIQEMNGFVTGGMLPDLTFIFDLDPRTGLSRISHRTDDGMPDRIEAEKISFHEKVRQGFQKLAREGGRYRLIDGERTVESIQEDLRRIYSSFLKERKQP